MTAMRRRSTARTTLRKDDLIVFTGVAGRNSDNTFIRQQLGWEPSIPIRQGLKATYQWIEQQYRDRKAGRRTVEDVA